MPALVIRGSCYGAAKHIGGAPVHNDYPNWFRNPL
jgi:hypothetical protein